MSAPGQVAAPVRTLQQDAAIQGIYRFEPLLAAALSLVAAPVIATAGVTIVVLSGRSPFVAHQRVGSGGVPFWMWKLRTMWHEPVASTTRWSLVERIAQDAAIPENKTEADDPRVRSRFSAFCRRHSIDELPQLFHVLGGQMSLVGPRPITKRELDRHYGSGAEDILQLRPGLTGLWQINGRSSLTYAERYQMDLDLVRRFNCKTYFTILMKTIPKLISGADAR